MTESQKQQWRDEMGECFNSDAMRKHVGECQEEGKARFPYEIKPWFPWPWYGCRLFGADDGGPYANEGK